MRVAYTINGRSREADVHPGASLMDALRSLGYMSVKNGCDNGDCGSCAVMLDGRAVNACLVFAAKADGHEITTAESLDQAGELHPLQSTSLDLGAVQCGFCTPGLVLAAHALLDTNPSPAPEEVRRAIEGNLCRCTGYTKVEAAILAAAGERVPAATRPGKGRVSTW